MMNDRLNVPPELQHLIEKRELEDRRQQERRDDADRRQVDMGPLGAEDVLDDPESLNEKERRSGKKRRDDERRRRLRRTEDG